MFRPLEVAEGDVVRPWRPQAVATAPASTARTSTERASTARGAQAWPGLAGTGLPEDGAFIVKGDGLAEEPFASSTDANGGRDLAGEADDGSPAGEADAATAEQASERVRADAFDAGFAAGNAAARDAFAAELAELARAFARETAVRVEALEGELVALARAMASCAIRRELDADPALFGTLVREALESLAGAGAEHGLATVHLHPVDAELLGDACGPDVRIVPDPSLARGDCLVERGPSRIDASVHARLAALGEAAQGERADPTGSEGDE